MSRVHASPFNQPIENAGGMPLAGTPAAACEKCPLPNSHLLLK
jgi:hypothetical protein